MSHQENQRLIGITHLIPRLPREYLELNELAANKLLHSSPESLKEFGFERSYIFNDDEEAQALIYASKKLIKEAGIKSSDIEMLLYYSGLPLAQEGKELSSQFNYPAWKLAHELGLSDSKIIGLSQQGCSGSFMMIELARRQLTDSSKVALCVSVDSVPKGAKREIIYNLMSDAVSAVLVGSAPKYKVVGF